MVVVLLQELGEPAYFYEDIPIPDIYKLDERRKFLRKMSFL